jgi:enamine deaminase RidA (YjgF/YER057c/UK114 family)
MVLAAASFSVTGLAAETESPSGNVLRNPTGGYTHRTVEIPPGSRILYISGQTATDSEGRTPTDVQTQAEIVYQKIARSLADAGMTMGDLVKTTVYLIDPVDVSALIEVSRKYNPSGKQAGTLVYVKALATPDVRIEIEAVAAKLPSTFSPAVVR